MVDGHPHAAEFVAHETASYFVRHILLEGHLRIFLHMECFVRFERVPLHHSQQLLISLQEVHLVLVDRLPRLLRLGIPFDRIIDGLAVAHEVLLHPLPQARDEAVQMVGGASSHQYFLPDVWLFHLLVSRFGLTFQPSRQLSLLIPHVVVDFLGDLLEIAVSDFVQHQFSSLLFLKKLAHGALDDDFGLLVLAGRVGEGVERSGGLVGTGVEFAEVVFLFVVLDVLQLLLVEGVFLVVDHFEHADVDLVEHRVPKLRRLLHLADIINIPSLDSSDHRRHLHPIPLKGDVLNTIFFF